MNIDGLIGLYQVDYDIAKMGTVILARRQVEQWVPSEGVALMSIRDRSESELSENVKERFSDVLCLNFQDDIESGGASKPMALTDEDAKCIWSYFKKHQGKDMAIHCKAGASRSAAIGIARGVFEENYLLAIKIMSADKFCSNPTVLRKILAYGTSIGENPLDR